MSLMITPQIEELRRCCPVLCPDMAPKGLQDADLSTIACSEGNAAHAPRWPALRSFAYWVVDIVAH